MKTLFLPIVALFFSSSPGFAITFELIGPCSPNPVLKTQYPFKQGPESVGRASLEILDLNHIPHDGYESGIRSILNTPMGDEALEVISDREMRAYGWCYEIDGHLSNLMPDKVVLQGSEQVRWYYGFAHILGNQWVSYCEPAYQVRPAALCRH